MDTNKKNVTLDNLALMVAEGFNDQSERFGKLETRMDKLETRMDKLETRMDKLETEMGKLETEMKGLHSSVNNYLELSDKRYLELKFRQNVIAKWVKTIGDKTGVKINLEDLEKAA